jgi:hypothetical protein
MQMLTRAQAAGDLRPDMDLQLAAALFFGNIEMAFTALVMGMVDLKDPEKQERARRQIAESFLQGILAQDAATEVSWTKEQEKSAMRSKATKRS